MMRDSHLHHFIDYCNNNLMNDVSDESFNAKRYFLNDRGLSEETLIEHKIGYCKSNDVVPYEIKYLGSDAENKWNIQRYLRGRVIVPICSEFGDIVAVGTKVPTLESGNPWWNSKFVKSNHLFLLNKSRNEIFKKNKVYVVEGYIDALYLYQAGLKNVVAVMGTACTVRKIALIARYCNNVCLCFDSDENRSGEKAKNAMTAVLNKYSFCENISVIDSLPIGEDPADFVKKNGLKSFLEQERVLSDKEIFKIVMEYEQKSK